jgi:hypothetical protein
MVTMHNAEENLARFRYHTGATLRRLDPDEPCPRLYRDIGPEAMALFLRDRLGRLAGPFAPILYTRTAGYVEPYRDYEPVGRLVFLEPRQLRPWFSGVPDVYVASVLHETARVSVGFLPGAMDTGQSEAALGEVRTPAELREMLGGRCYDDTVAETLAGIDRLLYEFAETEVAAAPLRRRLQSRQRSEADAVRAWLQNRKLTETDLCTAWHHLPRERRALIRDALREFCNS